MKSPTSAALALAALSALAGTLASAGCGGGSAYADMSGAEIYRRLCAQCHGPQGRATTGVGNSFLNKRDLWTAETLSAYLDDPLEYRKQVPHLGNTSRVMPALNPNVPDAAKMRLVEHVLGLMDALETGG